MAKKQLEDDLLTGGSVSADDKSAKKAAKAKKSAEKKAAKAAKVREKNEAKRTELKKEIDALKAKKAESTDEKEVEKLSAEIKKLSDKYSEIGSNANGLAPKTVKIIKSVICVVIVVALLVTYVATGAVRKGFIASLSIPAQTFTGMTVTNGTEKAKIKVATYNYYFAMTYNSMRNRQEQYTQYGLDPADYKLDVKQDIILAILKGIYSMSTSGSTVAAKAAKTFIDKHTYDITANEGEDAYVGAKTLNSAMQKACGDNKDIFKLVIMDSTIATNLENLQLLKYFTYTDKDGLTRELALGSWNGRAVLVDDGMPTEDIPAVKADESKNIKAADAYTKHILCTRFRLNYL